MVSLLATTSFALHTPLALWFDRRSGPASAAPRADDGFDQVLQLSGQAGGAPGGACLCVTPESKLEEEGRVVGAALCVGNAQEQSAALALVGSVEWILVEAGAPQPCIAVLTRTSRSLRAVRTGYEYQPPACCTYRVHVTALGVPYVPRTMAPQVHRSREPTRCH